jgi:uncharacterized protein YcfL
MKRKLLYITILGSLVACKSKTESSGTDSTIVLADTVATASKSIETNQLCFVEAIGKDSTLVSITINGDAVEGKMNWLPYEKDGAIGTLKGKKVGDVITADYAYVIEGSEEVEEKVFVLQGDKLQIKEGELEDKNGKLVMKFPEKAKVTSILTKVDCASINF